VVAPSIEVVIAAIEMSRISDENFSWPSPIGFLSKTNMIYVADEATDPKLRRNKWQR
jgi:hypothetical protein